MFTALPHQTNTATLKLAIHGRILEVPSMARGTGSAGGWRVVADRLAPGLSRSRDARARPGCEHWSGTLEHVAHS
ncbi:hypothetical protein Cob_v006779 [Colletotrichum orbiculare MAFF 240422]|uniref:Uncharacterized protein n=1 Tax=Colletotrichum orbiculare (strain 104-T / ATCC 96160 / CBS 514.97 / LARS 414 / MAFF 240422) TaxID=1213857 RepID=A0A484FQ84_COLOR|nr:hypothetical protein Cob_v006779 [Colletotrichum orbiculare MAFF 240422]